VRAPQRAQRVRGVPGVGLRTPDGREWLRWGPGHRWDPETVTRWNRPGWVVARCDHPGGGLALPEDDGAREMGACWSICKDCNDGGLATFTVKSCTRPGKYGNPWVASRCGGGWLVAQDRAFGSYLSDHGRAVHRAVKMFAKDCASWTNDYFTELAKFDYLSCFCPLDQPCHVDAIIEEGKRRGVWE
jgi:hypothetical protein